MGKRTEHAPGTFSWVDLTTSDGEAAKAFYGELLGWEFEDNEIPGDGGVYTICRVDGDAVAAIAPATDQFPPHWNNYVTVASADDTVAKAKELGGTVVEEPFDAMEAGRMALLQDPTGAMLCVWEPRRSIGAERVNDPGCLTWNELHTPDMNRALEFLGALFGWSSEEMETGEGPRYVVIRNGDRSNGGVMGTQPGEPPNWLPYFTVDSRDEAAEKAGGLGAQEVFRLEVQAGRFAVLSDPQGAYFAIFDGERDD